MNNLLFIQKIAEAYKVSDENPIKIFTTDSKIVIVFKGRAWMADNLDQCVSDIKQTFAIQHLEQIEMCNK